MKTIFEASAIEAFVERIKSLNADSKAQWGKMNAYQMVVHCYLWCEMTQSKRKYRRTLMGLFFGQSALKDFVKDDSPFPRNVPGLKKLKIKEEDGNFNDEKSKLIRLIRAYAEFSNNGFVHPFFGAMSKKEIGILAYKHTDHHLRQFGV